MKVPTAKELTENNLFSISIMILALVIILLVLAKDLMLFIALPLIIIVIVLMLLFRTKTIVQLKKFERMVVHTFGRISRITGPGWAIAIP